MQLGSKKTTYNLHLQLGFENPHPTFKMLCVTIVQPGTSRSQYDPPTHPGGPGGQQDKGHGVVLHLHGTFNINNPFFYDWK